MIDSIEKLYAHVNRYGAQARLGDSEGALYIYGGCVGLHVEKGGKRLRTIQIVDALLAPDADPPLELLELGGVYVPIADFDVDGVVALIERLEALDSFRVGVANYDTAVERLKEAAEDLHPDDRASFPLPAFASAPCPDDDYRDSIFGGGGRRR